MVNSNNNIDNKMESFEEIEIQKKEFKKSIQELMDGNLLNEAEYMINEYSRIIKDDFEIYSIKSILYIYMGDFDKAKQLIEEGLLINYRDYELTYNLAYLYHISNDIINAYNTFKKAKLYCKNDIYRVDIDNIIEEYEKNEEIIIYKKNELKEKNNLPKVTIIIPAYNQKEHLEEAIDSCLCQDYPNLEILIGDDCSSDGTDKMIKKYDDYDEVIYIKNCKNLGANYNPINLLYNHTSSKYGMLLNHDDYLIKDNYISKAIKMFMEDSNLSFIWANCKNKNEKLGEYWSTNYKLDKINNGVDYFTNYQTERFPHITGTLTSVFDFDKLKDIGKWGINGNENSTFLDTVLYLKLMLVGNVGFVDECVAVYRIHDKSISYNFPKEYDDVIIKEYEAIKEYTINNKILNINQGENWLNNIIFSFIYWRFITLWETNFKKDSINLLVHINKKYPIIYNKILDNIS